MHTCTKAHTHIHTSSASAVARLAVGGRTPASVCEPSLLLLLLLPTEYRYIQNASPEAAVRTVGTTAVSTSFAISYAAVLVLLLLLVTVLLLLVCGKI